MIFATLSFHNVMDDIPKHIRQPHVATVVTVGEFQVIQAQEVENRRVDIVHVHGVMNGVHAKVIGTTIA